MSEPKSLYQSRINACWNAQRKNLSEPIKPITRPIQDTKEFDIGLWHNKYMHDFVSDVAKQQDEWLQDMITQSKMSIEHLAERFAVESEIKQDIETGKTTIEYRLVERNEME